MSGIRGIPESLLYDIFPRNSICHLAKFLGNGSFDRSRFSAKILIESKKKKNSADQQIEEATREYQVSSSD